MTRVLIVGATSTIAQATAKHFAAAGDKLFLTGRSDEKLQVIADDLRVRGAEQVHTYVLDVNHFTSHAELLRDALSALGELDVVLIAHGTLPDQEACENDLEKTLHELSTNALSTIALLTPVARQFEEQGSGTIAVISSVAGDRGRQSNYVYGTAKAAVSTFLSGLRNRLYDAGVNVVTIKPGFVDTPMTAHLPKNALFASPEYVGKQIYDAIVAGKDVVYIPWFWRFIMLVIKLIPEPIFKRLNL